MTLSARDQALIGNIDAPNIMQPSCPKCRYTPLEFLCNVARTGAGHLKIIPLTKGCAEVSNDA